MTKEAKFKNDVFAFLDQKNSEPIDQQIHMVWYVIGVKELVDKTVELLPELYTEAIIIQQKANLKIKRKTAMNYLKVAAGSCFAAGFVPIPFTSPLAAIGTQAALCTKIAALYGYAEWVEILDEVGGVTITSILTYIATGLVDIVAFVTTGVGGSVVLGSVSGAVAATYIVVLGLTYTSVFEKLTEQDLSGSGREEIEELIRKTFKQEFEKYSSIKILSPADLDDLQ